MERGAGASDGADITLRLARSDDVSLLEALIALSARALQAATYSPAQIEGALGMVFAVDRQLIADETYFVAERNSELVGCGGWSRRKTLFGGDRGRSPPADRLLDPSCDAARIRAFFVHPAYARRGIGRLMMSACERAAAQAGFRALELVATLAGEPLYAAFAFQVVERYGVALASGLSLPVVRMTKALAPR
ncbi:MAG: GNAT family N-acetyltransferase [Betaproteobacteria bacterium 13_1_40CM_4_64_4]|nr:MAG: GNAT family N-acetyltransferase [Betaproteobacteria bacterium 13_1_40CM_4_64_4]